MSKYFFSFSLLKQGRRLEDVLLDLAGRFTNDTDVRRLGSSLKIPSHTVESTLTNNRHDICSAAYVVLKEWEKGQQYPTVALKNLTHALKPVGFCKLLYDVMDSSDDDAQKLPSKRKTGYKLFPLVTLISFFTFS